MDLRKSAFKDLLNTEISFGISKKQWSIFLRQFSALIKAGLGVDEALFLLSSQKELKTLRKTLTNTYERVISGESLHNALSYENLSDPLLISMVQAGEETGKLDVVAEQLSVYYEKEYEMKQKIRQALLYPIILLFTLIIVLFFLFQNVLPTFIDLFSETGSVLPLSTRILLSISSFFNRFSFLLVLLTILLAAAFIYFYKKDHYRRKINRMIYKIPFLSKHIIQIQTGHTIRTLSILNKNSIPFLRSLYIAIEGSSNLYYKEKLMEKRKMISEGEKIWKAFSGEDIFPELLISMLKVGEKTGSIGEILETTADFYEKETDYAIKSLVSIFEPLMIILMSVIIGYIVIAIATPMFDLINNYSV